ncbi:hypothetical protein [Paludifilum halophilum]|uniref:Uncharacterized protein n=1 Tax=Paludifilum halophilum TaxID=1642702 RepID=A0A235BBN6_9BACL|nr:hypothetical protein [Paludifilum halophilum]OYD09720.1 hypothetical protein CHM34_01610 [Paludifilum halophilum]
MQIARHLFASVFISAMIAALLSLLPALERPDRHDTDVTAFHPFKERVVTEETLVDFLSNFRETDEIRTVDLEGEVLSIRVDFKDSATDRQVYDKVLSLIRHSLVHTENVSTVRLRVHVAAGEDWMVEARREDLKQDPQMKNAKELPSQKYMERMFQVKPVGFGP